MHWNCNKSILIEMNISFKKYQKKCHSFGCFQSIWDKLIQIERMGNFEKSEKDKKISKRNIFLGVICVGRIILSQMFFYNVMQWKKMSLFLYFFRCRVSPHSVVQMFLLFFVVVLDFFKSCEVLNKSKPLFYSRLFCWNFLLSEKQSANSIFW